MRLTNKLIDYVTEEVAGKEAVPISRFLKNKKNVSEFLIAEELKKDIKEVRKILYKLFRQDLISSIRKKDKQKGWYIYYWTLKPSQIKKIKTEIDLKNLKHLKKRLQREEDNIFFVCEHNCIRLNFDQSTNFEFKCPECGSLMHQQDNKEIKKQIKKEIDKINKEIKK